MSFFKRAVISALTRREERREENIEEFDNDVKRGLKILEEASARKKDSDEIIRNRKKIIRPLQISAETSLGYRPSMEATIYAHQLAGKNPEKTNQILKGLARTTDAGKDMAEEMPSTTEPLTGPQQMSQAFAKSTEQTIRTEGETPETMGSRVASTVLGTLLGRAPNRSVSETVRQKYIDTFENKEQGERVYNELMNYRNQRASDGDPAEMPDLDPADVRLLQAENRKLNVQERLDNARLPVRKLLQQDLGLKLKGLGISKPPTVESFAREGVLTIDAGSLIKNNNIKNEAKQQQIRAVINDFNEYRVAIEETVNTLYTGSTQYTLGGAAAFERARASVGKTLENNIFTGTDKTTAVNKSNTTTNTKVKTELRGGKLISKQEFINAFAGAKDYRDFKRRFLANSKNREFQTDLGRVVFKQNPETLISEPYLFEGAK
tara:strand:- start:3703 stop:5010 length:1308 start_codon:yes stop_codon:yes gene_type:complete